MNSMKLTSEYLTQDEICFRCSIVVQYSKFKLHRVLREKIV